MAFTSDKSPNVLDPPPFSSYSYSCSSSSHLQLLPTFEIVAVDELSVAFWSTMWLLWIQEWTFDGNNSFSQIVEEKES